MFKNLSIYRLPATWKPSIVDMEAALAATRYIECAPSQETSIGWVPPREENGAMVESVAGQRIIKLMIETKTVPASAILKHARQASDDIEASTGRKPGRKEMRGLKEEALQALLPQAFPKQTAVLVWIDHDNGLLMHDAGSQDHGDAVVTALVHTFDGLALTLLQTATTPQSGMTEWLLATDTESEWPDGFSVERACELKSADEDKATVQFKNHNLNTDEVRKHIAEGKLPTRLAMSWEGRVAFTLTEAMQLKKLAFLDGVLDDQPGGEEDGFDADVMLATGELSQLIPALISALGGEIQKIAAQPEGKEFGAA